jgi:signal transduction histidine kinase
MRTSIPLRQTGRAARARLVLRAPMSAPVRGARVEPVPAATRAREAVQTAPTGAEERDTKSMLRLVAGLVRLLGFAVVGAATFISPPSSTAGVVLQIVTYALCGVGIAGWLLADGWSQPEPAGAPAARPRTRALRPYALGLVVAAGTLGATAGSNGTSMIAPAAVALLTASSDESVLAAGTAAVLGMLAAEVGGLVFNQGFGTLLGFPVLLAAEMMFGRYRATYRIQAEQARALLAQQDQLQAEQRRADVLDERARIAREIHDVLAHSLGALSIQIQAARVVLTDYRDVDRALETLATAQRMASEGLTETRRAVHALRTDTRPLHEEIAVTAEEHADRYHVAVRCETVGEPAALPPEATVALVRTAQESLVNAAKHAPGRPIDIDLQYDEHGIRVTIANDLADAVDGASADEDAVVPQTINGGYGLTGMRERLKLLRGTLDAGVHGRRWIVTADLPLEIPPRVSG